MTSPVGFVKSTNHAPGAPRSAVSSASSSTTGTVRSAFANPPGPVVSWPMHPNRSGIVSSWSRAAWPPTRSCTITKSAPSSASVPVGGEDERPGPSDAAEHALGERADDLEALRIDVQEHELVHREPIAAGDEPLDELRGVGAAAADHRDLHTHAGGIVHSAR